MNFEGNKLVQILKARNNDYYSKIDTIKDYLIDEVYPFVQLKDYTKHGISHSMNILFNLERLLPESVINEFNDFELFALVASAFLHDVGMAMTESQNESDNETRKYHTNRSRVFIEREYEILNISFHEAEIVGVICEAHGRKNLNYINDEDYSIKHCDNPRVSLLASLLRLGDILDVWSDRTPEIIYRHRAFNGVSKEHWDLHRIISNVKITNSPTWDIVLVARISGESRSETILDFRKSINQLADNIQNELNIGREFLERNGLYFKLVEKIIREEKAYKQRYTNPFILLNSFTNRDIVRFAGRLHETIKVKELLYSKRLVLVIGESGVGKTSLINAGVIPMINSDSMGYKIIRFSFSKNPEKDIANMVKQHLEKHKKDFWKLIKNKESLFDIFETSLNTKTDIGKFIFVGDHLEQLFTLGQSYHGFINEVSKLFSQNFGTKFLFCIREDYLPQLFNYSKYIPELYDRGNTYRLFKFDKANALEIFTRASEYSKIKLPIDFIEIIIDDLYIECEGSIFPPYLQIVGHELYEALNKLEVKEDIDFYSLYGSLGGVKKIVSDYLSSILDKYRHEEKSNVAGILSTMTTDYYTKKRVSLNYLQEQFPNIIDIEKYLNSLINDRIIRRTIGEYELAHDFLALKIIELIKDRGFLAPIIRKAMHFVENNYSNAKLKVADIAVALNVTAEYLGAKFKKELGYGVNHYINTYRINKAKIELLNTGNNVKAISEAHGFASQNTFSRNFKKFYFTTPTEFREKSRKKTMSSVV